MALQAPTYDCTAGYYCGLGSSVSNPHDSDPFHVSYVGETCVSMNPDAVNDTDLLRVKAKLQTVKQLYDTTVCSFYGYFTSGQDKQKPLLK